jgi:hypothetical protein
MYKHAEHRPHRAANKHQQREITHHTISVAKSSQTSAISNCYCPKKKIESGTNLLDFRS